MTNPKPSPVRPIVERFGGAKRMGELLLPDDPARGHDRVRQWIKNHSVPAWHFNAVVEAGSRAGVKITHAELAALAEAKKAA